MPEAFRRGIPPAARLLERLRDLGNSFASLDPMMLDTFRNATLIACTTSDTAAKIPRRFQGKCIVLPAIGVNEEEIGVPSTRPIGAPRFLFIGRLLYWKGLHLALRALAQVKLSVPRVSIRISRRRG